MRTKGPDQREGYSVSARGGIRHRNTHTPLASITRVARIGPASSVMTAVAVAGLNAFRCPRSGVIMNQVFRAT